MTSHASDDVLYHRSGLIMKDKAGTVALADQLSMPTFREVLSFVSKLRLELVVFLYYAAYMAAGTVTSSLFTQKICYPDTPPDIRTVCTDPQGVKEAAELSQVKMIIRSVVPAVVCLLAGSWRDATRKTMPLIYICHIGEMLAMSVELISSLNWNMSPWLAVSLDSVVGSLLGGTSVLTMASLTFITEASTTEDRSIRILVFLSVVLGASTLSTLGGKLLTSVGYMTSYIIILAVYACSLFLSLFIKDGNGQRSSNVDYFSSIKRLRIVFMWKPNNIAIWTLICSTAIVNALLLSEASVSFLYLQSKFKLPPDELGFLSSYRMIFSIIGAVVSIPVLRRFFKLSGFQMIAVCTIPSIVSAAGMAFATDMLQLYIFSTFDCLRITLLTTLMTVFTGCLPKAEIGIYNSFLQFFEGFLPLALSPLYTVIFNSTFESWPGAFYFLSVGLLLITSLLSWIASRDYTQPKIEDDKKSSHDESSETEKDINANCTENTVYI